MMRSETLEGLKTQSLVQESGEKRETSSLMALDRVPMDQPAQELTGEQRAIPYLMQELSPTSGELHTEGAPIADDQTTPLDNSSALLSQVDNLSMLQSRLQVDMTAQINKYFQQRSRNIQGFDAHRDKFVLVANHRIKKEIKRGELQINEKCEQLRLKEKDRARARELQAKRRMVQMEKYEIIRKLKTIQQEETDLVHRSIKQGRNRSLQMKKIAFTHEQKQKVAELLKAKQEFESSLQHKTEEYIRHAQMAKKAEEEELKRAQEAENNRKKEEIARRLKEMEMKTEERKEILKKSAIKVHNQYIHKQLQNKYRSRQKIAEQQTQSKLKELTAKHKLNIDQINQHDRKYTELLQKRSRSLSQLKTQTQPEPKRYKPTHFARVVDQELFQIRQKNYQKLMKVKENQYKAKIAKYQQKIDQEHKPKVDPTKSIVVVPRTYSSVTLTNEERIEKGLEYLAKAKQMKRSASEVAEPPKQVQNYGYKAYKDYLKERQPSNIDATEKQFKQIMSSREHKDPNSLLRAKFLAQGLDAKSKKSTDDKLFFSAKTKLALLSQLY